MSVATSAPPRRFSGRVAPDDLRHQVVAEGVDASAAGYPVIAPTYVTIPGIGQIPQYGPTITGPFVGYSPASDCGGAFMSARFQPNNNCYAYSCDIASNSFAQPGRRHGFAYSDPPTGASVQQGAELDGLIAIGATIDELRAHAADGAPAGHYVALLISASDTANNWPGDYHWVRCDDQISYASWSQKDGGDQVTDFDFAGQPISDPSSANWTVNQGPISSSDPDDLVVSYEFFSYMYVPQGAVDII